MNKYITFYQDLKAFLIDHQLEEKHSFIEIPEIEIDKASQKIPLAYKEWLKIFGNVNCLLSFPYFEDYSLEKLIELQDEEESAMQFTEEKRDLLLITFEGLLYVYIVAEEENPTTYFVGMKSQHSEQNFRSKGRFTTHIRSHIMTLMHHLKNLNKLPSNIEWFKEKNVSDIFDKTIVSEIEEIEDQRGSFFSIPEYIDFFNSKTTAETL
ncbi:hypothetical protein K0U91_12815 [Chryseobacterium chendengshani]|uniref:hypothetical protein n=1 Tax=Chryseobacterium sp. LJ668 TaxID=2864040 RepID=UPI001C690CCE|nr:hypothetical protein [Chryseobacterium sp. LJ668]MBW8523652.1 hypothetical protein [Chryseobacterium sp. LJ668]QYK15934.1 hypothetical protein K0U91_12815 [Chryseobacterium sp. LJ668]